MASNRLSRRRFLEITGLSVAGVGVLGVGYARGVEPGWVDLERVEVSLAGMSQAFDGYRVVQISDVHDDGWMTLERLSDVIRRVNGERPDLVVFTGDLVTADDLSDVSASEVAPRLVGSLREVRGRDGAVAVLEGLPGEGAAHLLAHEPNFADRSAESGRFGLQISGHSHGGQVSLPGVGPPVLPPLGEKYPAGRYEVGGWSSTPTGGSA